MKCGHVTLLYSGKEEHHYHGISIIANKAAYKALVGVKLINECIVTARFQSRLAKTTVIQVCALTETSTAEEKNEF